MKKNNNFFSILKFTYLQGIKAKSFIITIVVVLLLMLAAFNLDNITKMFSGSSDSSDNIDKIAVVNHTGSLTYNDLSSELKTINAPFEFKEESDVGTITAQLEKGDSDYKALIDFAAVGDMNTVYYNSKDSSQGLIDEINGCVDSVSKTLYAQKMGLDKTQVTNLLNKSMVNEVTYFDKKMAEQIAGVIVLCVLLYLLLFYVTQICNSVVEEKTNKIFETLICYAKPSELMFGKIAGNLCRVVTQIAIYVVAGLIMSKIFGVPEIFSLSGITTPFLILSIANIILGFLIYSCLFIAIVSFANNTQESQQLMSVGMIVLVAAFYIPYVCIFSSNVSLLQILSFVPFFAPLTFMPYFTMSELSAFQIALNIIVQVVEIVVVGFICSKLYRKGICGEKLLKKLKLKS